MSHYCVAVFSDDPTEYAFDKLLKPYNENDKNYYTEINRMSQRTFEGIKKAYIASESNRTLDEYIKAQGYVDMPDGEPAYGYRYNPNAKWDWYSLDGRECFFPVKARQKYDNDYFCWRKRQINFKKAEEFPYAFITPDGVWHSPGTVGWFATSDETDESRAAYEKEYLEYIANRDNPYVNFVDCHI